MRGDIMKDIRKILSLGIAASMAFSLFSFTSCSLTDDLPRRGEEEDDEEEETEETEETEEMTEETKVSESAVTSETRVTETSAETEETESSQAEIPADPSVSESDMLALSVTYEYKSSDSSDYWASYYNLLLTDDCKSSHPELAGSLDYYNAGLDSEAEDTVDVNNLYSTFYVRRADSVFLSGVRAVRHDYYDDPELSGVTFNVATGEILSIENVISDAEPFMEKLISMGCDVSSMQDFESGVLSFVVENDGITVISGDSYYKVLYKGNESFFSALFVPSEEYVSCYADMTLSSDNAAFTVDLGNDGTPDSVTVNCLTDEYGNTEGLEVDVNGNEWSRTDIYGYGVDIYVASTEGKNYLFLELSEDNDYCDTYVLELTSDEVTFTNEFGGRIAGGLIIVPNEWISEFFPDDTMRSSCEPTDPGDLYICQRTHCFSSYSALYPADFYDEEGFEIDGTFAYALSGVVLTALQDIDVITYPDGVSATIPSGTELSIDLVYDYSDTVIVKDRNTGEEYYLSYDSRDDYPRTVNGIPEDELLSGIMYAG